MKKYIILAVATILFLQCKKYIPYDTNNEVGYSVIFDLKLQEKLLLSNNDTSYIYSTTLQSWIQHKKHGRITNDLIDIGLESTSMIFEIVAKDTTMKFAWSNPFVFYDTDGSPYNFPEEEILIGAFNFDAVKLQDIHEINLISYEKMFTFDDKKSEKYSLKVTDEILSNIIIR